jgi:hypothetical protein
MVTSKCASKCVSVYVLLLLSSSLANRLHASTCDFTISSSTTIINGRSAPYNQIQPGNTLCIPAGTRGSLSIRNLNGTQEQPITIINSGGQVVINTTGYGFYIENSHHFRITGTGSSDEYGFLVQKATTFGALLVMKTDNVEMDHIEFRELTGSNIGIHAITNASCPIPNGRNNDDYDYNFDGKIDILDAVNRDNYTQRNLVFHHNKFQGFIKPDNLASLQMAYYVGNSNFSTIPYTRNCFNPDGSTTTGVTVVNPIIEGVHIYNNIIDTLGDKTLQVGSATKDCNIHHNSINRGALDVSADIGGININPGSNCDVHHNLVTNTRGNGVTYGGSGGKIYNNIIANVGLAGTYWHDGIYVYIRPEGFHHHQNTYVFNNTIINPVGFGITFGQQDGSMNYIQNNIIINPGFESQYPGRAYINVPAATNFTIDHNLKTIDINTIKFIDPGSGDYRLFPDSPAVDTGINLASQGIIDDYLGANRPQGNDYDIGAHEYLASSIPGDANNDAKVDGFDYIIWLNHYYQRVSGVANGDFDTNGIVDGLDYIIWRNHYNPL